MSDAQSYEWKDYRLNDLGELSTSSVDKKIELSEQPVSLINYMDVYRHDFIGRSMTLMQVTATASEVERFQVQKGDVLFTPSSETPDDIGHAVLVTEEIPNALHSYHTVRFRQSPRRFINGRYGGHIFKQRRFREYVGRRSTGSTRYTLSLTELGGAPVSVPPEAEQPVIAQILDTLDTQIRQTEALIAKLETVKQGLLTDLLTRGIDENGQLRPPPEEAPELYKDSPLGRVPRDWGVDRLEKFLVGRPKNGHSPQESGSFTGRKMLGLGCLTPYGFKPTQLKNAPSDDPGIDRALLVDGDLLITRANTRDLVGLAGVYRNIGLPCSYPDLMMKLTPASTTTADFLELALRSSMLRRQIQAMASGTSESMVKISGETVKRLLIMMPGCDEQLQILTSVLKSEKRLKGERDALSAMRGLKTGLVDDLLTGRVRVTPLLGTTKAAQTS